MEGFFLSAMEISTLYRHYLSATGISTDSRKIEPGGIFFALKGPQFNGNQFAEQAIDSGAALAVIDEKNAWKDDRYVLVNHVLETLQQLANHHRRQLNIPVIGITGSNGKTTTKELIHAVLSTQFRTHATAGNFNNDIGVPLTLLAMPPDTEIAVIEMGANHVGEIAVLCQISEPTHGIITNIGKAHLEGFGSLEGVKKAKGELYDYLRAHGGQAFIYANHDYLLEMAEGIPQIHTFGPKPGSSCETELLQADPLVEVQLHYGGDNITSQLAGAYNFENISAAICIGLAFGVAPEQVVSAIRAYRPTNNRSQIITQSTNTFIMDAYNANPTSVAAAINNLAALQGAQKMVILGDMLELGKDSEAEHRQVIELLKNNQIHEVVLVGDEFGKVVNGFACYHFPDVEAARTWFAGQNFEHFTILVKGSRKIGLEKLLS